jgi:hypothetical protein
MSAKARVAFGGVYVRLDRSRILPASIFRAALGLLAAGIRPDSLIPSGMGVRRTGLDFDSGFVSSVSGYNRARCMPYIRDVFPRVSPATPFLSINKSKSAEIVSLRSCRDLRSSRPRPLAVRSSIVCYRQSDTTHFFREASWPGYVSY